MLVVLNILGILFCLAVAYLFSADRKHVDWRSVGIVLLLEIFLAWFLVGFPVGRMIVKAMADGFNWLVEIAYDGIKFALPDFVSKQFGGTADSMNFLTSALLPILLVVPLFDILTYIGILPWIIKWIGKFLSFITGQPKFEAFFSVEMMFLGNTEVLAVSKQQLQHMSKERNLTLALMSMSCVTASILGSYMQMMPGQFVLTAVPLNILGAIIITSILNPVKITPEEDQIYGVQQTADKKEPFFSFLGDSILGAGRLILIILFTVISFVALASLIDHLLALTTLKWLSLENIMGIFMYPFTLLMGFDFGKAFELARFMGTKLVTNEFVVMGEVSKQVMHHQGIFASAHARAVLTVFLTSFANFGTLGMIIGAFKGLVQKEKVDYISGQVPRMLLSGILVSALSATLAGLFIW
ncbi:NupC/NupG family nucleoside CNT transporter [Liquorilactobacillus ghanensis]|uniref:NupC/NupG family nucleoside CNT transporter n=1 Tax=Liquorilactobacillus ghanensis TaxID=399370 RepID=UPI0039E7C6CC